MVAKRMSVRDSQDADRGSVRDSQDAKSGSGDPEVGDPEVGEETLLRSERRP
jgi:hypothetical protein